MSIVTIRPDDKRWTITDGVVAAPRAAFEISNNCPNHIVHIIQDAIHLGYLKPVAYVLRKEFTYESLL